MMADSPPARGRRRRASRRCDRGLPSAVQRRAAACSFVQVKSLDSPDHANALRRGLLHGGARARRRLGARAGAHVAGCSRPAARSSSACRSRPGLPLLVKQIVRTVAGWRKIGHYPGTTSYSWRELAAAVFAGRTQHVTRPVFEFGGSPAHDHKGFNWMVLRDRLAAQFEVTRVVASPFSWLGPRLATQVWFICRLREGARQ